MPRKGTRMLKLRSNVAWLAASASLLALAGCGSGSGNGSGSGSMGSTGSTPPASTTSAFTATTLDSNITGSGKQDPNLSHGWGISFAPGTEVWVADHGSNKSTLYDGNGNIDSAVVVNIPANKAGGASGPTGTVSNSTTNFAISKNGVSAPAQFLFVGTGGTLSGWAQSVDSGNAVTVFDGSDQGAVYTGLAIYTQGSTNMLMAANAGAGSVDVFDAHFNKITLAGGFKDPNVPTGYKPFGIQTIGTQVYVSYAHFTPGVPIEDHAAGLGFVDIFDATGTFVKRLVDFGGALNAPWGMTVAPASFGQFSNDLLIGDFGDGKINVYDPSSGAMIGTMSDSSGAPLVITGLWGLAFGNGAFNQPTTTLFYAAGPTATQGVYGRIDLASTSTTPTPTATPTSSGSPLGY